MRLISALLLAAIWCIFPFLAHPYPNENGNLVFLKPPPPDGIYDNDNGENSGYRESCGLKVPLKADWDAGVKDQYIPWIREQFNHYLKDRKTNSFPQFLRNKFAANAFQSTQFCDGIGSCTLGSCLNFESNMPKHDLQMAYYTFESFSNIDHFYEGLSKTNNEVFSYMKGRVDELVNTFTSAPRLEADAIQREETRNMILQIVTASLLMATALASGVGGALPVVLGTLSTQSAMMASIIPAQLNLATSIYIGLSGMGRLAVDAQNIHVRHNKEYVEDIKRLISSTLNTLSNNANNQVTSDLLGLMSGDRNYMRQDIVDLLTSGEFIEPDLRLRAKLKFHFERYFFAVTVNALWTVDRVYILDTDSPFGRCLWDNRGPVYNRVCLPERPGRTYWLYSLDRGTEDDWGHDDQAQVKGPTGYRKFFPWAKYQNYGISLEDIVRSSLDIHENNLERQFNDQTDFVGLYHHFSTGGQQLSTVPGAFTIPVCRNPGGEAISSVWDDTARNYPCMCGEFAWKNWYMPADETKKFLYQTGFYLSEDWEDYCSDHNDCETKKGVSINFNFKLPEDDTRNARHQHINQWSFYECTDANAHEEWGDPNKDWNKE